MRLKIYIISLNLTAFINIIWLAIHCFAHYGTPRYGNLKGFAIHGKLYQILNTYICWALYTRGDN